MHLQSTKLNPIFLLIKEKTFVEEEVRVKGIGVVAEVSRGEGWREWRKEKGVEDC